MARLLSRWPCFAAADGLLKRSRGRRSRVQDANAVTEVSFKDGWPTRIGIIKTAEPEDVNVADGAKPPASTPRSVRRTSSRRRCPAPGSCRLLLDSWPVGPRRRDCVCGAAHQGRHLHFEHIAEAVASGPASVSSRRACPAPSACSPSSTWTRPPSARTRREHGVLPGRRPSRWPGRIKAGAGPREEGTINLGLGRDRGRRRPAGVGEHVFFWRDDLSPVRYRRMMCSQLGKGQRPCSRATTALDAARARGQGGGRTSRPAKRQCGSGRVGPAAPASPSPAATAHAPPAAAAAYLPPTRSPSGPQPCLPAT